MNRVISLLGVNTIKFSKDNRLPFLGKAYTRFISYPYKTDNIATLTKRASILFYNVYSLTAPQQFTDPILSGPSASVVQPSVCPDNHLFDRYRDLSHVFSGHFSDNLSSRFIPQDRKGSSGSATGAFFKNFLK